MIDYFALLDEPRRPWINPEALKAKFLALSAKVHPDRWHKAPESERIAANQRYSELNSAHSCLCNPKERLRHLLELERGTKPDPLQPASATAMDLFSEVSRLCRDADAFLAEKAQGVPSVLAVQLFETGQALADKLHTLQEALSSKQAALLEQLQHLNVAWESAPPVGSPVRTHVLPCSRLEQAYRDISYLTRWVQQVHERAIRLSLSTVS